jgi:arylsulfatase
VRAIHVLTFFTYFLTTAAIAISQEANQQPNVIVLVLDQLRADRLHCYGNPRETSPNIDRLAAEGVKFDRFYAAASWTTPSEGTLHTSLPPSRHLETLFWTRQSPAAFQPETDTMALAFKRAGYRTSVFSSNPQAGRFLIGRGVDHFDQRVYDFTRKDLSWTGLATNQRILRWIDGQPNQQPGQQSRQPFFTFINYWEPHSPYEPAPEHDLWRDSSYPNVKRLGYPSHGMTLPELDMTKNANLGDRQAIDRAIQLYDGFIHEGDAAVGDLIEGLKQRGLDRNTIIVITSDHGQLLWQHSDSYMTYDHRSLFDAVVHIPAIFWGPGIPKARTTAGMASHIDIGPTLTELAGIAPMKGAMGKSLRPIIFGETDSVNQYVFHEQDLIERLRAVRDERYKLIWNSETNESSLYDTQRDPMEQTDIKASNPDVVERLKRVLDEHRWNNENPAAKEARTQQVSRVILNDYQVDNIDPGARFQLQGFGWQGRKVNKAFRDFVYWSEPASADEPVRKAIWRPENPLRGEYNIHVWYSGEGMTNLAPDAPFSVITKTGPVTVKVNQQIDNGRWIYLGRFKDPLQVELTNQAGGRVIADCLAFQLIQ